MLLGSLLLALGATTLPLVRESLTGTHQRYVEAGQEVNVTIRPDGRREEMRTPIRPVTRRIETRGLLRTLREIDPDTGRTLREIPLYYNAKPARVFDPNPVAALNDSALHDRNDSAGAVPDGAYKQVELADVVESGTLAGPHVRIAELQGPVVAPVNVSQPLFFNRSESGFEDVNAYYHLDRSQRRLQDLGYNGTRSIARYPIDVDTHAAEGSDNSFFIASPALEGYGSLVFGEGGTDDAEDQDLLVHEYAHAIHEWIAPGTFLGVRSSEARAISEGFGDYWTLSTTYEGALATGRDPFCFADWDARCGGDAGDQQCAYPVGADCLRRFDSSKTVADFILSEDPGTEHRNGEIWASALRQMFVALIQRYGLAEGRRISDQIVIESFFGAPPNPSFQSMAGRMLIADQYLSGGRNQDAICTAMSARGILAGCSGPRGEWTWFQAPARGVTIPDADLNGVTLPVLIDDPRAIERLLVNVNLEHSGRGELRISLIAPDGTEVQLQNTSGDRTANIATTFGRDSVPAQSLDVFRGRPAAGEWRLRVVDVAFADVGRVLSWTLVIQFAGDEPLAERPSRSAPVQFIPIVGRTPGANGTFFITDVRLLNRQTQNERVTLIFTPSGANGRSTFSAVDVVAPAGAITAFDDVVGSLFMSGGTGQLEIIGNVEAMSRTYTRSVAGDYGLAASPAVLTTTRSGPPVYVPQLQSGAEFRSNVGWAETAGESGVVQVRVYDAASGLTVFLTAHDVLPFSHVQIPVSGAARMIAEVRVIAGGARVASYGSVIDNRSGDPVLIPAANEQRQTLVIAPAIGSAGVAGTYWRTDLWITGTGLDLPIRGSLNFVFAGEGDVLRSGPTLEMPPPFHSIVFNDVVAAFFGPDRRGSLSGFTDRGLMFTSRIWTQGPSGTYGQVVPFRRPSATRLQDVLFVESTEADRTNVGAVAGDAGAVIVVRILDAEGSLVDSRTHALPPYGFVQFQVLQPLIHGRASFEVLAGSVYAYASVVSNRSGDPIFVPAQ
jgi:subtilisin-like proprotein convertase family protein